MSSRDPASDQLVNFKKKQVRKRHFHCYLLPYIKTFKNNLQPLTFAYSLQVMYCFRKQGLA